MNTKNTILTLLEKNCGKSLSGEEIAQMLHISRNAVWKAVNSLRKEGYRISSANNRGYTLLSGSNILSVAGMLPFINNQEIATQIHVFKTVDSTNKLAKEMAVQGGEHGTVIIADTQTSGVGRYRRPFYSPSGSGLYMSFIFRTEALGFPDPSLITTSVAVAVCRAIQAVSGKRAEIKWINDIYLNEKKICGILTEAITDLESGCIDWIVAGIGIYVNNQTADFPDELQQVAGSLYQHRQHHIGDINRNRLAAEIINRCLELTSWQDDISIYEEYRERSLLLGHRITVCESAKHYEATAIDIDRSGRLIVRKDSGEVIGISSAKVSVRRIES